MSEFSHVLAEAVCRARTAVEAAEKRLEEAAEHAAKIAARIADVQARQREITEHRVAGKIKPAETAEQAALVLDLETLQRLHSEALSKADPLREPVEQARAALAAAEGQWQHHQDEVRYQALLARAREHEAALLAVVRATAAAGKAIGHRHARQSWVPTRDLERAIQGAI